MKAQRPLTITGGRLVLPDGVRPGAIRCVDGRIAAVGDVNPGEGDEVVDAAGALVAPGLVDFGVFAIDKPAFHFGGITRAALMPDRAPPLDRPSSVRFAAGSSRSTSSLPTPARSRRPMQSAGVPSRRRTSPGPGRGPGAAPARCR